MTRIGLPHSEIPGSKVVCTSPRLIAAYHVLHRLSVPRHPPYALISLTKTGFQQITIVLCKRIHTSVWQIVLPNPYSIVKEQSKILQKFIFGGDNRDRTGDLRLAKPALSHLSYIPKIFCNLVGLSGVEPLTSRLSGARSNQLSYRPA